jgi:hypothetical protein
MARWNNSKCGFQKGHKDFLNSKKTFLGHRHSEATRKKMSISRKGKPSNMLGKHHSEETKRKISLSKIGTHHTEEARKKISISERGEKNNFWKGGLTEKNKLERKRIEFRLWREAVFARDNWICQECNKRGGNLHPHHIKSWSKFPELRFAIDNGITLCVKCHRKTDTYGRFSKDPDTFKPL